MLRRVRVRAWVAVVTDAPRPSAPSVPVASSGIGDHSGESRSARRASLENTSTIGWREPEARLQPLDLELLVPQHERDDDAGLAGAGGAARAVQVGLVVLGRVEVDDHVDVVDVDAAGGHVGGDEHGAARRP